MIERIRNFFNDLGGPVRQSRHLPDEQIAICAILLEVAEADSDFAPEERQEIIAQLRKHFELTTAQVESLIALTYEERKQSTDLWPFTRVISKSFNEDRKLEVLTMVWRIILADGRLDPYEEQLARRLQTMLSVNQSVLIEAKQQARKAIESGTPTTAPPPRTARD